MDSKIVMDIMADNEDVWQNYAEKSKNLAGDAGFDLYVPETVTFGPNEAKKVSMGIKCAMYNMSSRSALAIQIVMLIPLLIQMSLIVALVQGYMNLCHVCAASLVPLVIIVYLNFRVYDIKRQNIFAPMSFYLYPRSSIANTPLRLINSVGVIDSGYRGPIIAALQNIGSKPYILEAGTRIVQICTPTLDPISEVKRKYTLSFTTRGDGGFGSTNVPQALTNFSR